MAEQGLVIFTAIAMEARAVARGLGLSAGKPAVEVMVIGIGGIRLLKELPWGVGCVILAGFGGALDPALKVGDVVLDWPGDQAPAGPFCTGQIHSANAIVATAADKAALFAWTGAAAVEMEGDAVRRLLAGSGIPLIGLRAITDAADEGLDPATASLVDEIGQPRALAVAGYLARDPRRIASLRRLRAAARLAGQRLGEAMSALVKSEELKRLLEGR